MPPITNWLGFFKPLKPNNTMAKECNKDGCTNPRWGKGYCAHHQYMRTDKKPKELKRTPLKASKKAIKKESSTQLKRLASYRKKRDAYMVKHPACEVCAKPANDLHHKNGRGVKTDDERYFMVVCRGCHNEIHANPVWARENGYLI